MRTQVVVTEYGRSASQALAHQIASAKQGVALAPVTVVVPSNFAGLAARRMLGSGVLANPADASPANASASTTSASTTGERASGVINVNFVTPFRFAELVAVGQLGARKPLTKPVLAGAVRQALAKDPGPFHNVRDHAATERAIAAVVGELSNVSTGHRQALDEHGGFATAILKLFREVKSHLGGFHDEADVARAAAHRPDLAQILVRFGHVIWYLPGPMSAPLASFLRAALREAPATVIAATTGDRNADSEVVNVLRIAGIDEPTAFRHSAEPLPGHHDVANPDPGSPDPADSVAAAGTTPLADHIISVTDADEEVRAVLREIIQLVADGVPLHRIGVFHPAPDPYVRILEQHFAAADIAANGPSRRRLGEMIAGRVLMASLALPAERWRRDRVIALVNSGPLRHGDKPARPAVWDIVSRYAGVVGGLHDWRAKLDGERRRLAMAADTAMVEAREDRATRYVDQGRDVDDLVAFIDSTAAAVAAVEQASGWQGRSEAAAQLLHQLLGNVSTRIWWPESETAAFESVEAALERLALLDGIDPDPSMAVFTRALATELSVARDRNGRFGNGVVYGPLSSAPGQDLDAVFVLGCTEGLCPAPRREDVLLSDNVRKLAGGDLPLRLGQIDEQHRLFLAALAAAPIGRRWLFLPRGDLRSSRRSRPSRWLLPSASNLAGRQLYATDFDHENPPGVFELQSHAQSLVRATHYTSLAERDLAQVYTYVRDGGEASSHPASALVRRGLTAQTARRSSDFTEFDGNVAAVATETPGAIMSASRLETWATCGFRYYLGYVLGLSERDDPERTIDLSALDRGSAMHDILEKFMREQVETGPPAPDEGWSNDQRARAQEIGAEVFAEYERRGRTGRPIEWQTQRADLLALIDDFLTNDDSFRASNRATPAHFELAFGMSQAPLTVTLDDGRTLQFRGMIDRVDTTDDGAMVVSDYKTGKGGSYKSLEKDDDPTQQGTLLQLGLYAEAVAQQLGASKVRSDYWMVNAEVGYKRFGYEWSPSHRERLFDVLATISDGIEDGVFAAVPGDWESFRSSYKNCAYCPFDAVCPRDRAEQAADKVDAKELAVRVALTLKPEPDQPSMPVQ